MDTPLQRKIAHQKYLIGYFRRQAELAEQKFHNLERDAIQLYKEQIAESLITANSRLKPSKIDETILNLMLHLSGLPCENVPKTQCFVNRQGTIKFSYFNERLNSWIRLKP